MTDRDIVDPEHRYPSDGPTLVEQNALRVMALVPADRVERTRDVFQIGYGGERGVVLVVTAEALERRTPTVEWTMGAYAPAPASRLWKRRTWSKIESDEQLLALIRSTVERRRKEFVPCRFCGEAFPPERRHGRVCHGCAERHLGIVH